MTLAPERTAARTALWRALHLEVDAPPPVFRDDVGLALLEPAGAWRERHDMVPALTARSRATIVGRARFIEDLVIGAAGRGVRQYVLLGAGLDTFAQRRPRGSDAVRVFEVDQPDPQAWKRAKLIERGYGVPDNLRLVPVNFEENDGWLARLTAAGFDPSAPAVVASTGVIAFLTRDAVRAKLRQIAALARGTAFVMTFLLPLDRLDADEQPARRKMAEFARASGNPWRSLFTAEDLSALCREAGFSDVRHVSSEALTRLYFSDRADGLRPSSAEEILVATA